MAMARPDATPTSARRLLLLLVLIPLLSACAATVLAPWLSFSWSKIFRRAATVVAGGMLLWLLRRDTRGRLRWLGLAGGRLWQEAGLGGAVAVAAYGVVLCLLVLTGGAGLGGMPSSATSVLPMLLWMLPAALLIGVLEELFFRGWVLQALRTSWGFPAAACLSSLLYAAVHLVKDLAQLATKWPDAVGLLLLGLLFAYTRAATGRLFVAIGLHSALVYVIKVDGLWVTFAERLPRWFYGTPQLVNGLLGWLGLAAAFGLLWWRFGTSSSIVKGGAPMIARRKAQSLLVASLILAALSLSGTAWADEAVRHDPSRYHGMARKLGRGVANVATGVFEIPRQMKRTLDQEGAIAGLTVGVVKGVGWAVSRELVGIYEVVTFVMPQPNEYGVILEPEFVYSRYEWQ